MLSYSHFISSLLLVSAHDILVVTSDAELVVGDNPRLATTFLGIYLATRGIGNILSTPISVSLSHLSLISDASASGSTTTSHPSLGLDVDDGKFAKMILFAGTCFAGVGIISLAGLAFDTFGARSRGRSTPR